MTRRTFRQHIAVLRREFPLDRPVIVRRVPMPGYWGWTTKTSKAFYISLNKDAKLDAQKDTITHEWAHCMVDWAVKEQHCAKWGIAYARISRYFDHEDD